MLAGIIVAVFSYRYFSDTMKEVSNPDPLASNHNQDARYYNSRFLKSIGAMWLFGASAAAYAAVPVAAVLVFVHAILFYVFIWNYLFKHHRNMCNVLVNNPKLDNGTVSRILNVSYIASILILGAICPVIGHFILLVRTSKKHRTTCGRCEKFPSTHTTDKVVEGPVRVKQRNHTSDSFDRHTEGDTLVETTTRTTTYYNEIYQTYYRVYRCENCGHTWERFSSEKLIDTVPLKTRTEEEEKRY